MTFAHFIKAAKDIPKQRLAVAAAEDEFVLEAAAEAAREGLIEPILIGNMGRIREIILKLGLEGEI
jgi:phosphate butyryltransferase